VLDLIASGPESRPLSTPDLSLPLLFSPGPDGVPQLKPTARSQAPKNSPTVAAKSDAPAASPPTTQIVATAQEIASTPAQVEASPMPKHSTRELSDDERHRLIALAAFERARTIGFGRTNPLEDWLWAERHVAEALHAHG
jgi:hypothetical protein